MKNNNKIIVKTSELAEALGWPWTTVATIIRRQAPADKLKIVENAREILMEQKEKALELISNNLKSQDHD